MRADMSQRIGPKLTKWPFLVGDAVLLCIAWWILNHYPHPLPGLPLALMVGSVVVGAWLAVTPFLTQFRADLQFAEAASLAKAVEEINNVRTLANQISFATAQWQVVQEHANRSVEEARKITQEMTTESKAFAEFMAKANDKEKAHLRLEAEKLRRAEHEWLQVVVALMDHVYALYRAASQSGQPNLVTQLGNFQNACREIVRRLGLVPFEVPVDTAFDQNLHQVPQAHAQLPADARIAETLAPGLNFQGQLLRKALVLVQREPTPDSPATTPEAPADLSVAPEGQA